MEDKMTMKKKSSKFRQNTNHSAATRNRTPPKNKSETTMQKIR